MKDSPVGQCLHPIWIVNKYTGKGMHVSCGKCKGCLLNKASRNSQLCDLEAASTKYQVFVTLTYANSYIPLASFYKNSLGNFDLVAVGERESNVTLGCVPESQLPSSELYDKFGFGSHLIPYLSHYDLDLFLKRFDTTMNRMLQKYYPDRYDKKNRVRVRYYAAGEYGPKSFRPHFHLEFFFNEDEVYKLFSRVLNHSWQFGRTDCQLVTGKASKYVASYIGANSFIPHLLKIKTIRPFSCHSTRLGWNTLLQIAGVDVYASSAQDFVTKSWSLDGKVIPLRIPANFTAYFYPKIYGFSTLAIADLCTLYRSYATFSRWFGLSSPMDIAYQLLTDMQSACHNPDVNTFLHLVFTSDDWTLWKMISPTESFSTSYEPMLKLSAKLYGILAVSRHFLGFVLPHFQTVYQAVLAVQKFYDDLDSMRLDKWYRAQEFWQEQVAGFDGMDCVLLSRAFGRSPSLRGWINSVVAGVNERFEHSIKHRQQNEENRILYHYSDETLEPLDYEQYNNSF